MATITTPFFGSVSPVSGFGASREYTRDTVLTETATVYSWLSREGHLVTLEGTFTYPGVVGNDPVGTVDRAIFDESRLSGIDMTVDFNTPKDLTALANFDFDRDLLNFFFGGADDITLGGRLDRPGSGLSVFTADGPTEALAVPSMPDTIRIAGSGFYSGDKYRMNEDGAVFADDTLSLFEIAGVISLIGDLYEVGTHNGPEMRTLHFGNDTFAMAGTSVVTVIGDAATTTTGTRFFTLNFGDDTVEIGLRLVRAYGDIEAVTGDDLILNAGADSISGEPNRDFLVGDVRTVADLALRNQINAGDDVIDGRSGNDLIFGDLYSDYGESTIFGGNDSLVGGPDNDTIYGDFGYAAEATRSVWHGGDDTIRGGGGK